MVPESKVRVMLTVDRETWERWQAAGGNTRELGKALSYFLACVVPSDQESERSEQGQGG